MTNEKSPPRKRLNYMPSQDNVFSNIRNKILSNINQPVIDYVFELVQQGRILRAAAELRYGEKHWLDKDSALDFVRGIERGIIEARNNRIHLTVLFHKCWGQAKVSPEYDKKTWLDLQHQLNKRGILV